MDRTKRKSEQGGMLFVSGVWLVFALGRLEGNKRVVSRMTDVTAIIDFRDPTFIPDEMLFQSVYMQLSFLHTPHWAIRLAA